MTRVGCCRGTCKRQLEITTKHWACDLRTHSQQKCWPLHCKMKLYQKTSKETMFLDESVYRQRLVGVNCICQIAPLSRLTLDIWFINYLLTALVLLAVLEILPASQFHNTQARLSQCSSVCNMYCNFYTPQTGCAVEAWPTACGDLVSLPALQGACIATLTLCMEKAPQVLGPLSLH